MTLAEVQVKWSVILIDCLGPDIFSTLRMKGHVLHRARAHLKVPGWSLVWNTLLTKKLPVFLSRLNEINGGCEKILPVSESFWSRRSFLEWLNHSNQHMAVCGFSLHQGSTESRKTLEQKFIFQIGTLNPNGINERFSFNYFIQLFFTLPGTNQ